MGGNIHSISLKLRASTFTIFSCSILDIRYSMLNYFFSLSSYFIENTDCVHNKNGFFALTA